MKESLEERVEFMKQINMQRRDLQEDPRPYVNSILVKISAKDLLGFQRKKNEYVQQAFRINKFTTFTALLTEACKFWNLSEEEYQLYDEHFHDLMSLSKTSSDSFRVEKFFETIRIKNQANLYLKKPDREKKKIEGPQLNGIQLRKDVGVEVRARKDLASKSGKEQAMLEDRENLKKFLDLYPYMQS